MCSFYLLAVSLSLLPQLVQVSAFVHIVQVEVCFSLRLRHLSPESLLQDSLLVGQPLTQVSPLEPVQVLQRQTGEPGHTKASPVQFSSLNQFDFTAHLQ